MSVTLGNAKLGRHLIHTFSMPPGRRHTCTAESPECARWCYGKGGHLGFRPNVLRSLEENHRLSLRPDFEAVMAREVFRLCVRCLRVHVVGDFYSAEYVGKWARLARRHRGVYFYAYTRAWADPAVAPALGLLVGLPNFQLWWSTDRSMPAPPPPPAGVRVAYMQVAHDDLPGRRPDLVFRVGPLRRWPAKAVAGVLVCPPENGVTETTCERCLVCVVPPDDEGRGRARRRLYALDVI